MAMATTSTIYERVQACLQYLAGSCDGARNTDGSGFNKIDAEIGREFAAQESLSKKQILIIVERMRKYQHTQLEPAGLSLPTEEEMQAFEKQRFFRPVSAKPLTALTPLAPVYDIEEYHEEQPLPEEEPVQPQEPQIILSAEQQALLKIMEETKQHLFITGRAGAGKSVLLRAFRESTSKRVVVAAPTGIAALNVKGQTLHSLFKLPPQLYRPGTLYPNSRLNSLLKRIDALVIDEISMVRADLLDAVDERLRDATGKDMAFGGVQIIMFGDPYQLPPVVDEGLTQYFEAVHGGHFFFNALVWRQAEFKIYELTQIFRQKDQAFKDILNAVRDGSVIDSQIDQLNARHGVPIPVDGTVTLTTTNALVTQINQRKLDQLPEKLYQYKAVITGEMKRGTFPTEEILQLKKGAQVVMLKNDQHSRWVNGTVGKIEDLEKDKVTVRIDGVVYALEKETWEEIVYEYDNETHKVEMHVASSFTQYPIRLAWALTIHKSQGQTYESVALDLTTSAFAHGQMYVALSRCTSLEGLYLKLPVKRKDIIVDGKVAEFMSRREAIAIEETQAIAEALIDAQPEIVVVEQVVITAPIVESVVSTEQDTVATETTPPVQPIVLPTKKAGGKKMVDGVNVKKSSEKMVDVGYRVPQSFAEKLNTIAALSKKLGDKFDKSGYIVQQVEPGLQALIDALIAETSKREGE